jgi:hypothetical protein
MISSTKLHESERLVLGTDEARQGVTGHNVRYVLSFGLLAVIVGFAAVGFLSAKGFIVP